MKQALYIIILALFTGLGSCKKFLDVKPEDSVPEDVVYSSEEGFRTHLNGIYLHLANESLYGGQLTMEMLDVLAQRYNSSSLNNYYYLGAYEYTDRRVHPKLSSAWNNLYRAIANANTLIEKADEHRDVFAGVNYELVKGEGLGLRAFLHFDVLRMFGPVYKVDSMAALIPYYKEKTTTIAPQLPAKEVIENIIADLKEAETYLQKDPIITSGKVGDGTRAFTTARHLRMNYYAVKLLQARVYLYANRKEEALAAAKRVIEKQAVYFPFVTSDEITTTFPDRVFSKELVFTLQDINITDKYEKYFVSTLSNASILAPVETLLKNVYENSSNDLRFFAQIWNTPSDGSKSFKCFYKYAPISDTAIRKYYVPLMRVTEAYLIAAEAATVLADKFQYLNVVRAARNLTPLATTTINTFTTELTKEYQKEFYGEGQLFFYYKRNNTASIINGGGGGNIAMNFDKYVLPLPESETMSRN
jgi:starch-binding outer membrane protein, SusD/RagB family